MAVRLRFCTSVGGADFLQALLSPLEAHGFDASVLSALSESSYRSAAPSRFLPLTYCRLLLREIKSASPGTIFVVTTNPFFGPAIAALANRCQVSLISWMWDLYPQAFQAAGIRMPGVANAITSFSRYALNRSRAVVFLAPRLRDAALNHFKIHTPSAIIPVGADSSSFASHPPQPRDPAVPFKIHYSGHMGRLHDWKTLAGALHHYPRSGSRLHVSFSAQGLAANLLRHDLASFSNPKIVLEFSPPIYGPMWVQRLRDFDAAFVTMIPGAEKVLLPSKVYTAFAAGHAILAVCPRESDLSDLVTQNEAGLIINPGDSHSLIAGIQTLASNRDQLLHLRQNAFQAAQNRFSSARIAELWAKLLHALPAVP